MEIRHWHSSLTLTLSGTWSLSLKHFLPLIPFKVKCVQILGQDFRFYFCTHVYVYTLDFGWDLIRTLH